MNVEFDPAKDRLNRSKHGVALALAAEFDFTSAVVDLDDRYDYGEDRMIGLGFVDGRLFVLIYVETDDGIRAISLRPASPIERSRYAAQRPPT